MFYSETLLAKTGPLARVWLAANLERKLTKQNVLTSNLEDNVQSIIAPGQAPMALRLSGQLLLGVVKIYSRKAGYLFDDCHDLVNKIKSAFRPGNVDLPASALNPATNNAAALILPDAITELDLFAPLPDPSELLREDSTLLNARMPGTDPTLLDFGTSQLLLDSTQNTPRKSKQATRDLEDIDIDLDFGDGVGERSVEIGRRETGVLRDEPTLLDAGDDMGLDFGDEADTTLGGAVGAQGPVEDDFMILDDDDVAAAPAPAPAPDLNDDLADDPSRTFHLDPTTTTDLDIDDLTSTPPAQPQTRPLKRRKLLPPDPETQLHNSQIKAQQEDRSGITRAPLFLPRDPLLLQLMEMQRSGGLVARIMGDAGREGWAPELRGILSLEVVRRAGEKKRKRDVGVGGEMDVDVDVDGEEEEGDAVGGLEIPREDDADAFQLHSDGPAPVLFSDDGVAVPGEDLEQGEEGENFHFDTTLPALLPPSHSGPISQTTTHAVHRLRTFFAPSHPTSSTQPPTPSKRLKSEAKFTDLCPEGSATSRTEATKMFFELLVLGTKDAVAVEQELGGKGKDGGVGGVIRVRGKRGLWGDWAEQGAGGEIASQVPDPGAVGVA